MDFSRITDDKIRKAYEDGEFEQLPGYGKKLELEDLSNVPPELRMAYKIIKNAGMAEEEQVRSEIQYIEDLIDKAHDSLEEDRLRVRLNEKLIRFNQLMEKKKQETNSAVFKNYQNKIHDKFLK
ncbi:J-domain-containing protein [Bacillus sp. FJAT-45066]|uniref:DnaJ family domain-containing protein n=1 Tax=Bacillus sp. FJAT-45066 TaxID=2011010 RepID=UPI000BB9B043|nr:DUF1992 domain-containing protein [Bacillus sp. FJAT-45066]